MPSVPEKHVDRIESEKDQFLKESARARRSFARELWEFVRDNKKWWMVPMILVLVLFMLMMVLSSTAAAPFIYSLF
jgi:hypothetical protein